MPDVDPGGFTSQYATDDALVPLTDAECQALTDVLAWDAWTRCLHLPRYERAAWTWEAPEALHVPASLAAARRYMP